MNSTQKVRRHYEKYPYPCREIRSEKFLKNYCKRVLPVFNESSLSFFEGKSVLEAGCGTGEFSNSLALNGAEVDAFDLSTSSIKKAEQLKKKFSVENVSFSRQDLFKFSSRKKYDIVFSLGVLHHTNSPSTAFKLLSRHVKKDSFICIGVYNRFGRLKQRLRKAVVGQISQEKESKINSAETLFHSGSSFKGRHWLADKYSVPVESYHSVSEVLGWLQSAGFSITGSKPPVSRFPMLSELSWLFFGRGAFFLVSGKKIS